MSGSFYGGGGGLTSPVAVADGGTGSTTAAAARTALGLGTAAVEALTTDGSTRTGVLGAADRRVLSPGSVGSGRGYWPGPINAGTVALTALRVTYVPLPRMPLAEFASLQFEVTALSAGNARFGLYASSSGLAATKIWDSGSVSVGSTGVKNVALPAGTWSDTSYKNGNNFRVLMAWELIFVAIQSDTGVTPTLRGNAATSAEIASVDAAMGSSLGTTFWYEGLGSFGLPATAGSLSRGTTAVPFIVPLEA